MKSGILAALMAWCAASTALAAVDPSEVPQGTYRYTSQSSWRATQATESLSSPSELRGWRCTHSPHNGLYSCSRRSRNPDLAPSVQGGIDGYVRGGKLVFGPNPVLTQQGSSGTWTVDQSVQLFRGAVTRYQLLECASTAQGAPCATAVFPSSPNYLGISLDQPQQVTFTDDWTYQSVTGSRVVVQIVVTLNRT